MVNKIDVKYKYKKRRLTVNVLLLGRNHFFRSGLAYHPCQSLSSKCVTSSIESIVQSLSRVGHHLEVFNVVVVVVFACDVRAIRSNEVNSK